MKKDSQRQIEIHHQKITVRETEEQKKQKVNIIVKETQEQKKLKVKTMNKETQEQERQKAKKRDERSKALRQDEIENKRRHENTIKLMQMVDNQYKKQKKLNMSNEEVQMDTKIISDELLKEIQTCINEFPSPVPIEVIENCIKDVQESLKLTNFTTKKCGLCGQNKSSKEIYRYSLQSILKFKNYFKPCDLLRNALEANEFKYENSLLDGLVFARDCIDFQKNLITVCSFCNRYLNGNEKRNRFMANGFYREINCVELPSLSIAELHLISINRPHLKIISLKEIAKGTSAVSFKGNAICYRQNINEVVKALPRKLESLTSSIQILFTGTGNIPLNYITKLVEVRVENISKFEDYQNIEIDTLVTNTYKLDENNIPECLITNLQYFKINDASSLNNQLPITGITESDYVETIKNDTFPLFHRLCAVDINPHQSNKDDLLRLLNAPNRFYIVKGTEAVSHYEDLKYYERSFPNEFPWGCGGPSSLKSSLTNYIKNYVLDDGTNCRSLQCDQDFLALLYSDDLSRKVDISFSIIKKTKKYSRILDTIRNEISSDSISELISILKSKSKDYLQDKTFQSITKMLNVFGTHIPGTPAERNHQRLIGQATLQAKGMYHFFFTTNYDDIHHPIVASLYGKSIKFSENGFISEPDLNERRRIACIDPVAVADFAHLMTKIMMLDLFGFDIEKKIVVKQGIFNFVEDIIYNYHDQGRGGLHLHFGGYLYGNLNPEALFQKLSNSELFKSKYIVYSESLFQTSADFVQKRHFSETNKDTMDIDHESLEKIANLRLTEQNIPNTEQDFEMPPQIDFRNLEDYYKKLEKYSENVSNRCMYHSHKPTCIKKLNAEQLQRVTNLKTLDDDLCRVGYGRQLVDKSYVKIEQHEAFLLLKRKHKMSIESNYYVTEQLSCNSAGHLIDSGVAGLTSCLYSLNYMSGHQSDDPILWEAILNRYNRIEEELKNTLEPTEHEFELKFLKSSFYALLAQSQKSLCLIAMFLRNYPIHYNSVNTYPIYYKNFIDIANSIKDRKILDIWVGLNNDKNSCMDYALRGNNMALNELTPLTYFRSTDTILQSQSRKSSNPKYNFDLTHPSYMNIMQQALDIQDFKIPIFFPPNQVPDTSYESLNETSSLFIILFFSNWTINSLDSLLNSDTDLIQYAKGLIDDLKTYYELNANSKAISMNVEPNHKLYLYQMYINMQLYYKSLHQIRMYARDKYKLPNHRHYEGSHEIDINTNDTDQEDEEDQDNDIEILDIDTPIEIEFNGDQEKDILTNYLPKFNEIQEKDLELYLKSLENLPFKSICKDLNSDATNISNISTFILKNENTIKTIENYIETKKQTILYERSLQIRSILSNIPYSIYLHNRDINTLFIPQDFIAMKQIITELTLTKSQIFPFLFFAGQLNRQLYHFNDQFTMKMIVFGNAGSGKSYVAKAIQKYYEYKNALPLLLRSALYGSQAAHFNGNTIHHNMNWIGITTKIRKHKNVFESLNFNYIWNNINLHAIDEVYTLNGKILNAIEETTKIYRTNRDINELFIGDPFQLPPVHSTPIFHSIQNISLKYQKEKLGQALYRNIPFCCEIPGNNRSSKDYACFLENYRKGIIIEEHLTKLEERRQLSVNIPEKTAYLVGINTFKVHINTRKCILFAKKYNLEIVWCFAFDQVHPDTDTLRDRILICNRNLTDMKTKNLPNFIPLVINHDYIITTNIATELNLAKGIKAKLVKIHWQNEEDKFQKYKLPFCLELKFQKKVQYLDFPFLKSQDHQTFLLYPLKESLKLPYVNDLNEQKNHTFIRHQFPIIPADSFTLYRSLGQSLESIAVNLSTCKGNIEKYTALSRIHDWENLYILDNEKLTKKTLISKWSKEQIDEIQRLRNLFEKTKTEIWRYYPESLKSFYDSFI